MHDLIRTQPIAVLLRLPLLILLTIILLTWAYQQPGRVEMTMSPRDGRFVRGANEAEAGVGGVWVRWTTDHTRLYVPAVAANVPSLLNIILINGYPADTPDPNVDIVVDGQGLTSFFVPQHGATPQHYQMIVPPQERAGWSIPIDLHSTTIVPKDDPRPVGVVLVGATIRAAETGLVRPPLWQMVGVIICVLSIFVSVRSIGMGAWWAWSIALGWAIMLSIGFAFWHADVAPFIISLVGLCVLLAFYGLVVGRVAVRGEGESLWVGMGHVILFFGLAYWLLPIYQLLVAADIAREAMIHQGTLVIGGSALLALLCSLVLLSDWAMLRHWQPVAIGIVAVAALVHLVMMLEYALGRSAPDFWILFRGAREWTRGHSMYDLVAVAENHFGHVFKVPPFYGMLFVPFVHEDGLMVLAWHRTMNIVLIGVTFVLLLVSFRIRLLSIFGAGCILLFNMRPLADTVAFGQIDIVLLFLLTIAMVAGVRGHAAIAGGAVALGTMLKLYPALFVLLFVIRRQWWGVFTFGATILLCNAIAIGVIGWEMHRIYLFEVIPRIGGGTTWVENQTINGFVSRLFTTEISATPFSHPVVTVATIIGFLGMVGMIGWLGWRGGTMQTDDTSIEASDYLLLFGLVVVSIVMTIPAAWMHYQTITILALFALLFEAQRARKLKAWEAALSGLAYACIAYGNQWSFYYPEELRGLMVLGVSYKLVGLLALTGALVGVMLRIQQMRSTERQEHERDTTPLGHAADAHRGAHGLADRVPLA